MAFKANTPINPTTETMDSMTDQDRIVSEILRLKYSLKSQKPPSFTCENIKLPAPILNTIKLGSTPPPATKGYIIPAAVNPAIVAEPTQTRIMAAINQPKTKGGIGSVPK